MEKKNRLGPRLVLPIFFEECQIQGLYGYKIEKRERNDRISYVIQLPHNSGVQEKK